MNCGTSNVTKREEEEAMRKIFESKVESSNPEATQREIAKIAKENNFGPGCAREVGYRDLTKTFLKDYCGCSKEFLDELLGEDGTRLISARIDWLKENKDNFFYNEDTNLFLNNVLDNYVGECSDYRQPALRSKLLNIAREDIKNHSFKESSLECIAKAGEKEDLPVLQGIALSGDYVHSREAAIRSIARLDQNMGVDIMLSLLKEPQGYCFAGMLPCRYIFQKEYWYDDSFLKRTFISELATVDGDSARPRALAALKNIARNDPDLVMRSLAFDYLAMFPEDAGEEFFEEVMRTSSDPSFVEVALRGLGSINSEKAKAFLMEQLKEKDLEKRVFAVDNLCKLMGSETIPLFVDTFLSEPDGSYLREYLFKKISAFRTDKRALLVYESIIDDKTLWHLVPNSALHLMNIGGERAAVSIQKALKTKIIDEHTAYRLIMHLIKSGDVEPRSLITPIMKLYNGEYLNGGYRGYDPSKRNALLCLETLGNPASEVLPALRVLMKLSPYEDRRNLTETMARLGDGGALFDLWTLSNFGDQKAAKVVAEVMLKKIL